MQVRQYQKFTQEDEETLINMVNDQIQGQSKRINWKPIAEALNKTPRYCYDFYIIRKQGKLEKHEWKQEEITRLNRAVEKYGTKWSMIKDEYFPGLTPNQLRNKYYHSTRMKRTESQLSMSRGGSTNENLGQSMLTLTQRVGSQVELQLQPRAQSSMNLVDFFNTGVQHYSNFNYYLPVNIPQIFPVPYQSDCPAPKDDSGSGQYIVFDEDNTFNEDI